MKICQLGQQDYLSTWQAMRTFTDKRNTDTTDELWLVEHPPVFTQGQAGKPEHLHHPGNIPVVHSDRGGQTTYHGPGQIVLYILLDLRRYQLNIRQLVSLLEDTVINLLADYHITGQTQCKAPGVYVANKKIGSIGLRIRNHCTYHGLAFNVAMDLEPFSRINPCGFTQLPITQLAEWVPNIVVADVQTALLQQCTRLLKQHTKGLGARQ